MPSSPIAKGNPTASKLGLRPLRHARGARAFSLVELLCVLVILIILATLVDSRMAGSRRRTARELCRKNLQTISLALNFYAGDKAEAEALLRRSLAILKAADADHPLATQTAQLLDRVLQAKGNAVRPPSPPK